MKSPNDRKNLNLTCQVCSKNDAIVLCCSVLGPVTFAYCSECLDQKAEDMGMFVFTYETCGPNVGEWVKGLKTFCKEKDIYISWSEFVQSIECGNIKVGGDEL